MDDQPYFIILIIITIKNSPPAFVTINKHDNKSINKFNHNIASSDELLSLINTLTVDPNINYNILHVVIQNAKHKHMPSNKVNLQWFIFYL